MRRLSADGLGADGLGDDGLGDDGAKLTELLILRRSLKPERKR